MADDQKVKALINLLDDPNEEVFAPVEQVLLQSPVEIVPLLEKAWEQSTDELFQSRLTNIIHSIQFNDVKNSKGSADMEAVYCGWVGVFQFFLVSARKRIFC